jgi:hypothetical protein
LKDHCLVGWIIDPTAGWMVVDGCGWMQWTD